MMGQTTDSDGDAIAPTSTTEPVRVIFRVGKDVKAGARQVIALFPDLPADHTTARVTCYIQRTGQHGAADFDHCMTATRAARTSEYMPLMRELQAIGYNLRLVHER
jgi:hypothetical protein